MADKYKAGDVIKPRVIESIHGEKLDVPSAGGMVHLQFRRFAGCPMCILHLHSFLQRYHELVNAGVQEVIVFPTEREVLLKHQAERLPMIADPEGTLYREFNVDESLLSVLHPGAVGPILKGLVSHGAGLPKKGERVFGLPADFLIAPDGRIVACKYGTHGYDQWSVDEVLGLAKQHEPKGR